MGLLMSSSENRVKHRQPPKNIDNYPEQLLYEFNINEYEIINEDYVGNISLLQHKITNEYLDRYLMEFKNGKEAQIYEKCYQQRMYEQYIVNAVQFEPISQKSRQFCSQKKQAYVYIEHIPIRLSSITDIPHPENIYILKCALMGFQQLYNIIGYFYIQEDHVCIDKYGAVKVWMNSDLSLNYPEEVEEDQQLRGIETRNKGTYHSGQKIKGESGMVKRIIALIQENTEEEAQLISFSDYFGKKKKIMHPTFTQTLQILDQYIKVFNLKLPSYCESIMEIFQDLTTEQPECRHLTDQTVNQSNARGQYVNQIHIPNLEIMRGNKMKNDRRNTIKKTSIKNKESDKHNMTQVLPPNILSTDRTVPLYGHQAQNTQNHRFQNNYSQPSPPISLTDRNETRILPHFNSQLKDNNIYGKADHVIEDDKTRVKRNNSLNVYSGNANKNRAGNINHNIVNNRINFTYSPFQHPQIKQQVKTQTHASPQYRPIHAIKPVQGFPRPSEAMKRQGYRSREDKVGQWQYSSGLHVEDIDPEILADMQHYL